MKYKLKTSQNFTSDFLENLLIDREIIEETPTFYQKYFNPTIENEYDSDNLDYIEDGYKLLKYHLFHNSKIFLLVDCDMDGYTSAALFYLYCRDVICKQHNLPFNVTIHTPVDKSHGLEAVIKELKTEKKYDLIVCPDSSSNDYEYHAILSSMGYDILVLDHHDAPHYSENAVVINNQLSQKYSNKSLSGVGIVYKFFEYWESKESALTAEENFSFESHIKDYLDLVAMGEVGDMMNMNELENRYICHEGLTHINNPFLKMAVAKQSFSLGSGPLTQIGVAFYIVPLVNALIRAGTDQEKEDLFIAFVNAEEIVPSTKRGHKPRDTEIRGEQVLRFCTNAKSKQDKAKEKAIDLLGIQISNNCLNDNKILILNADELNVSTNLTGLCAMALAAEYKKPVILGRTSPDGILKGSMRGREESELKDFKTFLNNSGMVDYVEGHANAAGVSIPIKNIEKLYSYANQALSDIDFNEGYYDADFVVNGNCSYLGELIEQIDAGKEYWGQPWPYQISFPS